MAQDNITQLIQNADVGIKISKPYYDVYRTEPENLIFSSSWPSLPIAYEINIDATALATYPTTGGKYKIPHNLGYPPLAFYWSKSVITGKAGLGTVYERNVADVDTNYVYVSVGATAPVNIKCFVIDLSKDVDYASPVGDSLTSGYDPNFGIKVVKQNKNIDSRDLRDFILHSRAQSPLIVAVKTEATVNPANPTILQYTYKQGYPVWVYGFARRIGGAGAPYNATDYYTYAPYFAQGFPGTNTDGILTQIFFGPTADGASLVVLRDPMFTSTPVTVQY